MKTLLIFTILLITQTCNKKQIDAEILNQLPSQIQTVYAQDWVAGKQESGSGTNFYIEFKTAFPENILLNKIYFLNQEANFVSESETVFTANFSKISVQKNMDIDSEKEFGNTPPQITKPKYMLQKNEAILEFEINKKIYIYKLQNIKQKELLAYPSGKPRN